MYQSSTRGVPCVQKCLPHGVMGFNWKIREPEIIRIIIQKKINPKLWDVLLAKRVNDIHRMAYSVPLGTFWVSIKKRHWTTDQSFAYTYIGRWNILLPINNTHYLSLILFPLKFLSLSIKRRVYFLPFNFKLSPKRHFNWSTSQPFKIVCR